MMRFGRISRMTAAAAVALLLCVPGKAYYQYVHYLTNSAPFTPVYEKFDLTALVSDTVPVYVNDQGPAAYAPNDSFGSVLSQVKQAVAAWNTVSTSQLKLAFGGVESTNQASNTPGIDVIFTDMPPGILGLGAPMTSMSLSNGANGPFFPIVRGVVQLVRNTNQAPGPSYLEEYYTTAIHEIGHALGLQHTWTSSAMSQDITRNTSRARPLDADDRASLSVLYGPAGWQTAYGTITGRVTFNTGQPVALASVVAVPPSGPAVSALTDPNGSYTIQGLPANNYLLYVHPLSPDATMNDALHLPVNATQQAIARSGYFQTIFYPGTLDPNQAAISGIVPISAGSVVPNLNFTVVPRSSTAVYDVATYTRLNTATRTYIYSGDLTVPQAYIQTPLSSLGLITVESASLNPTPVPQSATVLGGFGNATSIIPYTDGSGAVALYFNPPPFGAGTGPRHLVMNFGNDIYVLPDAVDLVQNGPPQITGVASNPNGSVTISGVGFGPDSTVFFDGLQAAVETPFNGASITVTPPQGASGQISTLTVFNSDGQNSMILQSQAPQTFSYPVAPPPQIAVSPATLPAGSNGIAQAAMVQVSGVNTNFIDGQTTVGFGSDDVTVRRVWVLSPTLLVADVMVAPNAAIGASEISVISGFQSALVPGGFQTQPAVLGQPLIALPIVNASQGQQTVYPGSVASIYGTNFGASTAAVQLTLNGTGVQVPYAGPAPGLPGINQINFQVPSGFPTGPATLQLTIGGVAALPVVLQINNPPPNITSVTNISGAPLNAQNFATVGDILNVNVTGLDPTVIGNLARVQVTISGVPMQILQIVPEPGGQFQIQIIVTQSFGGTQVPLAVAVDGSSSVPATITVR